MTIAVCVQRVPDPEARYRLTDGGSVDFGGAPWMMDPGDAVALEVAVALVERDGSAVTVYTVSGDEGDEILRTGLAQGAESAVRVATVTPISGQDVGAALAEAISDDQVADLILCGVAASDSGGGGTGAALAASLNVPIVQNVLAVDSVEEGEATVQRRRDGGYRELVRVQLPAVLTVERIAANPRFPTTRARMRAQRANVGMHSAESAKTNGGSVVKELGYQMPPPRLQGILWPEPELSARERMRFLYQGGKSRQANGSGPITGDPETVAAVIAEYLQKHGYVTPAIKQEN